MAVPFKVTLGAIDAPYQVALHEGDGSSPDLTGVASIVFQLQQIGATGLKVSAAAAVLGNPTLGQVEYQWTAPDVDTLGMFMAKWVVTFPGGSVRTYPSDDVDLVEIVTGPNLGYLLQGACAPWTTIADVRACCNSVSPLTGSPNYISDIQIQSMINVATDLLYTLSGQQYPGECVAILRPCGENNCFGPSGRYSLTGLPHVADPSSFPYPSCGCSPLPRIALGLWPITNVVYVKVDGALVPSTQYRLDSNRWITHLAGAGPDYINDGWPSCQPLDRPATEPDTFEVMVEYGLPAPLAGQHAAARLTCELAKACAGLPCNLPGRATSVNRQQIAFTMINPSMLDNGLTGIYDVDLFIMAYNPTKTRGRTIVWSPDLRASGSYRAGS